MLTKKEKKEYVFGKLDELLKPLGYKALKTGGDPCYILDENEYRCKFYLNFSDRGDLYFSKYSMSLKVVENIVEEINTLVSFNLDKKRYIIPTVFDSSENPYIYEIIGTREDLENFTNWMLDYLKNDGQKFIETYFYLPNVLKKMNDLEQKGKNWNELLSGTLDSNFRGLIIAKLCNDSAFDDKVKKLDVKFSQKGYEEWLPYYEKLKERLKSIESIYDI
ncbi:MAG: hypothetical protein Q4C98_02430 [Capnocytophaga sp.]|nr:hypothetical protein [Capnocytophaga sp.]